MLKNIPTAIIIASLASTIACGRAQNSVPNQEPSQSAPQPSEASDNAANKQPAPKEDALPSPEVADTQNTQAATDKLEGNAFDVQNPEQSILKVLKQHDKDIQLCFEKYHLSMYDQVAPDSVFFLNLNKVSMDISLDKEGNVKTIESVVQNNYSQLIDDCLDAVIKPINFGTPGKEITERVTLLASIFDNLDKIERGDGMRRCFENYMIKKAPPFEDSIILSFIIDSAGKAKDPKLIPSTNTIEGYSDGKSLSEMTKCMGEVLTQATFRPTVSQKDIPNFVILGNPYSYDTREMDTEESIAAMNGCLAKAKGPVNNAQYGFEWTIMPDGSLQDVHCTGKLDDAVKDCYIDIIKKWHYKPTLSGQKLKMYYEYYISSDDAPSPSGNKGI